MEERGEHEKGVNKKNPGRLYNLPGRHSIPIAIGTTHLFIGYSFCTC
jgi:hypothetical protein